MYIYGKKVFEELISSKNRNLIRKVFISESSLDMVEKYSEMMINNKIHYSKVPLKTIENMAGKGSIHQGIVTDIEEYSFIEIESFIEENREKNISLVIALDRIQDPHNLGAIIRTAYGAGADLIVLPKDNSAQITATVIKVSTGVAFKIDICRVVNFSRGLQILKENGYWVYGADMGGIPYPEIEFSGKTVLVFGNEGEGLRRLTKENCDSIVSVPMARELDSLNVSVSAGILSFAFFQRIIYEKSNGEK